jgi:hypothetical protein
MYDQKTHPTFGFFTKQGEMYTQCEYVKEVGEESERRRETGGQQYYVY